MNEIISSDVRRACDAVNRAKDDAVHAWITIGKRLCELKEICAHGTFAQTAEKECGLKQRQCRNLMKVYKEFGQNGNALPFSFKCLLKLTQAPDPQEALMVAAGLQDKGSVVTAAKAKTIVDEMKKDLSNITPVLRLLVKNGSLPEDIALEFSLLPPNAQNAAGKAYVDRRELEDKLERERVSLAAERTKVSTSNQSALDAIEAKDKAEKQLNETLTLGQQNLIDKLKNASIIKEAEITKLKTELWSEAVKLAKPEVAKDFEDKIKKAEAEADKANRKLRQEKGRYAVISDEGHRIRHRLKEAEKKLNASDSVTKDTAHARDLSFLYNNLKKVISNISLDCDTYEREQSNKQVERIIELASGYLGSVPETITIEVK